MSGRARGQAALRAFAVLGVALAPFAAIEAEAAVQTGPANANGPGIAIENSGGNREFGKGHQESKVTHGNKKDAPAAPGLGTLATPTAPAVAPGADKVAKAKALVDAARARAHEQVEAANQQAEEAVERAHEQSESAGSQGDAQAEEARARGSAYSSDD